MAAITLESLAERIAVLEQQVAYLLRAGPPWVAVKDWRRTVGMFASDEVMKEIIELGRQIREADRGESTFDLPPPE